MIRRPPRSPRTDTLFPYPPPSSSPRIAAAWRVEAEAAPQRPGVGQGVAVEAGAVVRVLEIRGVPDPPQVAHFRDLDGLALRQPAARPRFVVRDGPAIRVRSEGRRVGEECVEKSET